MLDPRRLLVFDAVLRAGSMSSAALELRYSPAAVSQQIAALELEAGTSLLRRLSRGVAPTAAGEVAGQYARVLAEQLASATAAVDAVARGASGPLRVSSFPAASAALLPAGLLRLTARSPDLKITVEEREAGEAIAGLRDGMIDIALVADLDPDDRLDTNGLVTADLGRATVSVMLPAAHRLAGSHVIALADLVAEPWIQSGDAVCAATVARVALGLRLQPRISTRTNDLDSARGLVAAGLGIALVTDLLGAEDGRGVVVRAVDPTPGHPVLALTLPPPVGLPAARLLQDALVTGAHEHLSATAR